MKQPIEVNSILLKFSCSIGYSQFPADGSDSKKLFLAADKAMYILRNMVVIDGPLRR